jgi:LysM repeat protein
MDQDENRGILDMFDETPDDPAQTLNHDKDLRHDKEDSGFKAKGHSLVIWILGIVIVVILLAVFFRGGQRPATEDINAIEQRIDYLNARVDRLEAIAKKMISIEGQFKTLEQSMSKLEASGKSLGQRLDTLAQKTESMPKATPVAKKAEPPPASQPKGEYHEVRRGDTLYQIGKKYGISVNRLRELNNLEQNQAIYPGQKLSVSP